MMGLLRTRLYPPDLGVFFWDFQGNIVNGTVTYLIHHGTGVRAPDDLLWRITRNCYVRRMYVRVRTNTLNGNAVFTLNVNAVGSALVVTLAAGVLTGENLVNAVALNAGDGISLEVDTTAAGAGQIQVTSVVVELCYVDHL